MPPRSAWRITASPKGLRDLFGKSKVALYTMDEEATLKSGADGTIASLLKDIGIEDIKSLASS